MSEEIIRKPIYTQEELKSQVSEIQKRVMIYHKKCEISYRILDEILNEYKTEFLEQNVYNASFRTKKGEISVRKIKSFNKTLKQIPSEIGRIESCVLGCVKTQSQIPSQTPQIQIIENSEFPIVNVPVEVI
jgi:hypothetical protein